MVVHSLVWRNMGEYDILLLSVIDRCLEVCVEEEKM